jgi:hypothetical protein
MRRGLRIDIMDDDALLILVLNLGGDFASNDALK